MISIKVSRAKAYQPEIIDDFFEKLHSKIVELGLDKKPANLLNVDETCLVCSQGNSVKVYCKLESKSPYLIESHNLKEAYTLNVILNLFDLLIKFKSKILEFKF